MKTYFVKYSVWEYDIHTNRDCGTYEGKTLFSTDLEVDKNPNSVFMHDLTKNIFGNSSSNNGFEKQVKIIEIIETESAIPASNMDPFSIEKEKASNNPVDIRSDGIDKVIPLIENEIAIIQTNGSSNGLIAYESLCRIREAVQKYIEFKHAKSL